jgi:hypothetical protein
MLPVGTGMTKLQIDFARRLNPIMLGLALALLPMGADALDFSPNPSRVVSDPAYLPLQGQVYGSTEYSFGQITSNTLDNLGAPEFATSTVSNTVIQVLEVGMTDDLTFRVSDTYGWIDSTNNAPSGASTVTHSDGFSDPIFGAIWRVMDEKDRPFNLDLMDSFAPNLFDAKSASDDLDGTIARGGATATLGTALSYETTAFTVYLQGTATYLGTRTILNQNTNITTNYDSSWQSLLSLSTQTRFADRWSLNAGLSRTFNGSVNASFNNNKGVLVGFTNEPGDLSTLTGALNYQVTPGQFVASLIYSHNFYDNGGTTNFNFPNSDTTTTDKNQDVFSAELRYVFN